MNKKNIFLWTLYDFANSIVMIVFFLYFSQWLVVDEGVSDFWYNMIFTGVSALLIITAPILGSVSDKNDNPQKYLNRITIFTFVFFLFTSLVALFFSKSLWLAVVFFFFATYFYQFSFVFYNALLAYIAPKEKWGQVSGLGQAGNWLGQVAGLLITLPFASGAWYLAGEAGRAQTFLPATLIFFLLALPMLLYFKLQSSDKSKIEINFKEEYKNTWANLKDLLKYPSVGMFLLAFFFFNDAIITAANNFPIYIENVFSVSDKIKSFLLMGILITSAIGAFITGFLSDKIGLKKSLMCILGSWVVIFPVIAMTYNFTVFCVMTCLMGFFYGATWAVSRAAMTALCPKDKLSFGFSFYTLAERVSTFVGPLTWGALTSVLVSSGPTRYRWSVMAMGVFVVIGIFLLRKVEIKEEPR